MGGLITNMKLLVVAACLAHAWALPQHMITLSNGAKVPGSQNMISLKSGVVVPGGGTMKTFPNGAVVPDSVHMQVLPGDVVVPSTGNMRTYSNGAVVPQVQSVGAPTSTHMVTHSNGAVVPAHTPAVAAAKANFQHAGGNIMNSFGVAPAVGHMVTHPNGAVVPADTPAIATAKANFAHVGGNVNPKAAMVPAHSKKVYSGPMAVPGPMVTHANGAVVPSDTPSVVTAKAKFHHAGGNIKPAKASFHHAGGNINSMAGVAPVSSKKVYSGPMVTHSNGAVVSADTPAIATARANFHQAGGKIKPAKAAFHHTGGHVNPMVGMVPVHSKKVYSGPMAVPGPMVTHSNGAVVPEDTPAVATAKANFHQAGG